MAHKSIEILREEYGANPNRLVIFEEPRRDKNGRFQTGKNYLYIARVNTISQQTSDLNVAIVAPLTTDGRDIAPQPLTGTLNLRASKVVDSYCAGHFYSPRRTE